MIIREEQNNTLKSYFESEKNNLTIVYGRPGIGKTTLVKEFMKDKRALYYCAIPETDFELLSTLNSSYKAQLEDYSDYATVDEIFTGILNSDNNIQLFVFEEFQNMVKADSLFIDSIVNLVNGKFSDKKIMVVLTSSSIAWIENSMVKQIGSAAFSINAFMKLKELSYSDTVEMYSETDVNNTLSIYALTGGVAKYMSSWNPEESVKYNIINYFIDRNGKYYDEVQNFIKEEFRETGVYNSILGCLAAGKNKLNEIHEYTGFGRDKISVYLKNLIEREIVEKVFSYDAGGNEYTRKGLYRIKDDITNFWYRFIYPYYGVLAITPPEQFYDKYIEKGLNSFLLNALIKVASEFLNIMNEMDRLPFKAEYKGSWYGKTGDIHLIYENEAGTCIIGQAYIGDIEMRTEDYDELVRNTELAGINAEYYYIFSASGFSEELRSISNDKLVLIGIEEL